MKIIRMTVENDSDPVGGQGVTMPLLPLIGKSIGMGADGIGVIHGPTTS
jgi:hypothetical protein